MTTDKRCTKCDCVKPIEEFYRKRSTRDGRSGTCKTCSAAYYAAWQKQNPDKVAANTKRWQRRNSDRWRAQRRDVARRVRAGHVDDLSHDYMRVLEADLCSYCGRSMDISHVDHIVPVVVGGNNAWENLTSACPSCNRSKSNQSLLVYLLAKVSPRGCSVPGCPRPHCARGLCNTHWAQQWREKRAA